MGKFFPVVKGGGRSLLSLRLKLPLVQNNLHTTEAHLGVTHSEPPQLPHLGRTPEAGTDSLCHVGPVLFPSLAPVSPAEE